MKSSSIALATLTSAAGAIPIPLRSSPSSPPLLLNNLSYDLASFSALNLASCSFSSFDRCRCSALAEALQSFDSGQHSTVHHQHLQTGADCLMVL